MKTIKNIEAYIKTILKSCKKNYRLSNDKVILPDNPAIISQKEREREREREEEDWSIEYEKLKKEGKSTAEIIEIMNTKYSERGE